MDEVRDICLEEVALEGLDGITVNALWLRLENREPQFNLKLDVFAKNAIWKSLVSCQEVQFYMLPSPRKLPTLPSEIRRIDLATGIIQILPQKVENPYPVHIISGDQHKVQGSCSTFSTRKHVTKEIREPDGTFKLTLDKAVEKFGDTLILVASQETRLRMLYGPDSCQSGELSSVVYAFLEWIGRQRHYGAFQPDAVRDLNIDHKMAFYYRKFLTTLGVVNFQSVARQEIPKNFSIVNLLFLKRKTVNQPYSRYGLMTEDVSRFLEATPHRMAVFTDVRDHLLKKHELSDYDMFRRNVGLMKSMGLIEKLNVPHSIARGYKKFTLHGSQEREISVGIIRLIKPYRVDQEEKEEEEGEMSNMNIKDSILYKGRSPIDQVYHFLAMNYFQDGKAFTRADLCNYFKLSQNYMRMLLRRLESIHLVKGEMVEMGRQKALAFIPMKAPAGQTKHDGITTVTDQPKNSSSQKLEDKGPVERKEGTDKKDKVLSTVTPKMNFTATRAEKRRKLMHAIITENKVLSGCGLLLKKIRQHESEEGITTKVDVKSLKRLLKKMVEDKEINEYQVQLEPANISSNKLMIYTIPSIEREHTLVNCLIKQEDFTRHGKNIDSNGQMLRKKKAIKKPKKMTKPEVIEEEEEVEMEGEEGNGSRWDTSNFPKMPRLQTTHFYLWYIVNDPVLQTKSAHCGKRKRNSFSESSVKTETVAAGSEGDDPLNMPVTGVIQSAADVGGQRSSEATSSDGNQESGMPSTPDTEGSGKANGTEGEKSTTHPTKRPASKEQTPTVYADTKDWKRFIAPLPPLSKDEAPGWFQLGEVLTRMPLLIFNQTCTTGPLGSSISKYLDDPIKRYFPLCELPRKMTAKLLRNRSHITKLEQNLKYLCKFGLIWIGPSEKTKEQRWFYLSTKAVLKDTTSSELRYMHVTEKAYPEMKYELNSLEDVGKYWSDCKWISLNTPLGLLKDATSSFAGVRRETDGLKDLLLHWDDIKTKPDKEGFLKGDGRGACGIDSSTFAHLRRNWIWNSSDVNKMKLDKQDDADGEEDTKTVKKSSQRKQEVTMLKDGKMVAVPITVKHVSSEQHKEESKGGKGLKRKLPVAPNPVKKAKLPKLIPAKRGKFFDETDQKARLRMKTRRAQFSSKEDNFLLLCCIASEILNEKVPRAFVNWRDIRNIMHEHLEVSKDKSSFAISKRATYIFNYPQTHINYATCLTEIREDEELINSFMSRREDYTNPEVCVKEYQEFLEMLIAKYKKQASGDITWLTDLSYVDLKAKYNIVVASDIKENRRQKIKRKGKVQTKSDVEKAVIQSLIMGALHTQSYSGYKPSVMFEIFSQYDEALLHDAFMYLREVSICSRWRHLRELTLPSLKRVLPHVPMSYQLSKVYHKFFLSRITKETLHAAADFLNVVEAETDLIDIPMDTSGEHSAVSLAILAMDQGKLEISIPEQIILFDKNDTEESNVKTQGSRKRPLEEDSDDDDDDDDDDDEDDDDDDDEEEDRENEGMENNEAEVRRLLSETQAELHRYDSLQDGSIADIEGSTSEVEVMEQKNIKLKIDDTREKRENELSKDTTLSSSDTLLTPCQTPSVPFDTHFPLSDTPFSSSNTPLSPSTASSSPSKRPLQTNITSSSSEIVQEDSATNPVLRDNNERLSKAENVDAHLQLPTARMSTGNNLLLLRGHFKRQLNSLDAISIKDEVVINSCDLKLSLQADSFHRCDKNRRVEEFDKVDSMLEFMSSENYLLNPFVPFSYHSPVSRCGMNVTKWLQPITVADKGKTWESFEFYCQSLSKFQDQLEDLKQVYQFINRKTFLGATISELKREFFDWTYFMEKANILIKEEMCIGTKDSMDKTVLKIAKLDLLTSCVWNRKNVPRLCFTELKVFNFSVETGGVEILEVGSDQLRLVTIENASPWVITFNLNESKDRPPKSLVHEGPMQDPLIGKESHLFEVAGTSREYPDKETENDDSKMEKDESQIKKHELVVSQEEAVETPPEVAGIISGTVSDETPAASETRNSQQRGEMPSTSETKTSQCSDAKSINMVYRQYYRIDGTTNYSQIQMLLTRLANFVIENPGYKEEDICIFMEPILHHVECLELLQKLAQFGCIGRHMKTYRKFRNPFDGVGHLHGYAYYMPAADCLLRLSLLTASLTKGSQNE